MLLSRNSTGVHRPLSAGRSDDQTKLNASLGEQDLFANLWLELVGEEVIPVNFEDREKSFPKAFGLLGKRISFYRNQLN